MAHPPPRIFFPTSANPSQQTQFLNVFDFNCPWAYPPPLPLLPPPPFVHFYNSPLPPPNFDCRLPPNNQQMPPDSWRTEPAIRLVNSSGDNDNNSQQTGVHLNEAPILRNWKSPPTNLPPAAEGRAIGPPQQEAKNAASSNVPHQRQQRHSSPAPVPPTTPRPPAAEAIMEKRETTTRERVGKLLERIEQRTSGDNCSIFLFQLPRSANEHSIRLHFAEFGRIKSVAMHPFNRSCGRVEFTNKRSAARAIMDMNGMEWMGARVGCDWWRAKGKGSSSSNGGSSRRRRESRKRETSRGRRASRSRQSSRSRRPPSPSPDARQARSKSRSSSRETFRDLVVDSRGRRMVGRRRRDSSPAAERRHSTPEIVVPKSPLEIVVPKSPLEIVVPKSPLENVVPKSPLENVVPKSPLENVVPKSPLENVVPKSPLEIVVPKSPLEIVEPQSPPAPGDSLLVPGKGLFLPKTRRWIPSPPRHSFSTTSDDENEGEGEGRTGKGKGLITLEESISRYERIRRILDLLTDGGPGEGLTDSLAAAGTETQKGHHSAESGLSSSASTAYESNSKNYANTANGEDNTIIDLELQNE